MIVITGAAGFIGSALVAKLNEHKIYDLVLVDQFNRKDRTQNLANKKFITKVDRNVFHSWFDKNHAEVTFVFHLGARTDTTEFNKTIFDELNVQFSKEVWKRCVEYGIALVYASSAATYGGGENGYVDNHDLIPELKPLNPYGDSKNEFDKWVLKQDKQPYFWAGLKFFNVYGPNEYHKERMASVILHAFKQITKTGEMKLFRSHNPDFKDGQQMRDFVYVKDVCSVCLFLLENRKNSAIYNLGSGKARTFLDLCKNTFKAMDIKESISFIDTPEDIRDKYQYFTEASMQKLIAAGYNKEFTSLEDGVEDYVKNYLIPNKVY